MGLSFKVHMPAIRGYQSGREFFTIIIPFGLLPKLFYFDEENSNLDNRSQRRLNHNRVPEIANYILTNDDWLFSSITATVTGEAIFTPTSNENEDIGLLEVNLNSSKFSIIDGQHRHAGIIEALRQNPELENETISVVLFRYESIERSNQMFADLNRYAQKPTKSLTVLYDNRDPLSQATSDLLQAIDLFGHYTDREKVSLPSKSAKLFTLGSLYEANKNLLRITRKSLEDFSNDDTDIIINFWKEVQKNMPLWEMVAKGELRSSELREEYICSHSVIIQALGITGYHLLKDSDWKSKLKLLQKVDWRRNNPEWRGVAIAANGRIVNSRPVVKLTSMLLRKKLNLLLTAEEEESVSEAINF